MADVGCKKILVILDVEVMTSGQLVGVKLGNPARLGSDGKFEQQPSVSSSTASGEVELCWEPHQRPGRDDDLQEAMDQLADLEI